VIVMPVRNVYVVDTLVPDRLHVRHGVRPPLSAKAGSVPPRIGGNPQPVCLDEKAGVPYECDPHADDSPSDSRLTFRNVQLDYSRRPAPPNVPAHRRVTELFGVSGDPC